MRILPVVLLAAFALPATGEEIGCTTTEWSVPVQPWSATKAP